MIGAVVVCFAHASDKHIQELQGLRMLMQSCRETREKILKEKAAMQQELSNVEQPASMADGMHHHIGRLERKIDNDCSWLRDEINQIQFLSEEQKRELIDQL